MKRFLYSLVILLFVASLSIASADSVTATRSKPSPLILEEITLKYEFDSLEYVKGTDYIIVTSGAKGNRYEGVINTSGEVLIAPEYGHVVHASREYFEVINENGINNHALINERNEVIIDFKYSDYLVLSPNWCLAVVLEETKEEEEEEVEVEEEGDYSDSLSIRMWGDAKEYNIVRYDVYNPSTATLLGSFTRQECIDTMVAGPYLKVENMAGDVYAYDASLQKITKLESIYADDYQVVKKSEQYDIVSTFTGELIASGYIRADFDANSGLIIVQADKGWFGGNYGAIDQSGKIIIPLDYDNVTSFREGFAKVETSSGHGLISAEGELVIPCQYDLIHYWSSPETLSYWWQGYCLVELNDKYGFINMDGQVTCEIKYNKNDTIPYGCSLLLKDADEIKYIIAADGTKTAVDYQAWHYGGNGMLLLVSDNNGFYLIDWYGNELAKTKGRDDFSITHDYRYVVVENEKLYKIVSQ